MAAKDFVIVVLAAGKGTRLKSARAKVLHRAGGRPLVEHVVRASNALKNRRVYVVVGHQAEAVQAVTIQRLAASTTSARGTFDIGSTSFIPVQSANASEGS